MNPRPINGNNFAELGVCYRANNYGVWQNREVNTPDHKSIGKECKGGREKKYTLTSAVIRNGRSRLFGLDTETFFLFSCATMSSVIVPLCKCRTRAAEKAAFHRRMRCRMQVESKRARLSPFSDEIRSSAVLRQRAPIYVVTRATFSQPTQCSDPALRCADCARCNRAHRRVSRCVFSTDEIAFKEERHPLCFVPRDRKD